MTDDDITLTATSFKVSATEKRSLDQYENHQPHVTIEGEVDGGELTPDARRELRARLLALHQDAQAVVSRAAENRIAHPDDRDWGVPKRGER